MFLFVFDGALFTFKAHRPAFVPLFQLPPRIEPRKRTVAVKDPILWLAKYLIQAACQGSG